MFSSLGRLLDRSVDDIVVVLAKKAGEVSNAGRDTFLAQEADRALAEMGRSVSENRAIAALLGCTSHKSATVRQKVASHLDGMMESIGPQLAASPLVEKVLRVCDRNPCVLLVDLAWVTLSRC